MKSLKALFSVGLAVAISGTALAETQNPLSAITSAAKESVSTQVKQAASNQVSNVNTQVQNVKNTVSEAKQMATNAKSALDSAKSSSSATSGIKEAAKQKVSEVKQKAVEKAKETVTNKVSSATKVNINTADAKTLQTLSGIGSAKAKAIIDYRNKVGAIKDIAELSKVSGIGSSTIEKIAPFLSF